MSSTRDAQQLGRLEAKIAANKAKPRRAAMPKKPTIDDAKASGDYLDAIGLKRRAALETQPTVIRSPLLVMVDQLVCTRNALYIHIKGRNAPQVVNIRWRTPTGSPLHDTPRFVCGCGKGCRKLFPVDVHVGGCYGRRDYVCRFCATAKTGLRYKSFSKSYGKHRVRVRASSANGYHPGRARDPKTGRFVKETPVLPPGLKMHEFWRNRRDDFE